MSYDVAVAQSAPYGYQDDAPTHPHAAQDAYMYEAWAAAAYDTGTYDAWDYAGLAGDSLRTPAHAEPAAPIAAATPGHLPHPAAQNAEQQASTRPNRTAPPRGRAGAVPTLALLTVLGVPGLL
ncbi:hypothetical protein [Streptomyces sp. NPDC056491]|uniref:hypothetical protein n=1 Tax=Streptomyces sp. NPDC056491 TaxID=3345837 RepID=UPI0036949130